MSLSLRRYQQSPKNQSAFLISTKNTTSKQKISSLNSSSSLTKNPQLQIKLPSLSRSSMRKSFSTFQSDRNTKFKLQTLQQKLQQLKHHFQKTRQQTKETLQFTTYLRQSLCDKELGSIHKDIKQKVSGLQNFVKSTICQNQARSNDLREDCNSLWNGNEEIKSLAFELRMRVEAIQRSMGFKG